MRACAAPRWTPVPATSSTERWGTDAGHDTERVTVVRIHGITEALRLLRSHLDDALRACEDLPLDTSLLKGMVRHFAARRR